MLSQKLSFKVYSQAWTQQSRKQPHFIAVLELLIVSPDLHKHFLFMFCSYSFENSRKNRLFMFTSRDFFFSKSWSESETFHSEPKCCKNLLVALEGISGRSPTPYGFIICGQQISVQMFMAMYVLSCFQWPPVVANPATDVEGNILFLPYYDIISHHLRFIK